MNKNKSLLIILIILIVSFSLFIGINILGKKDNKEEANTQLNPVSNTQDSINNSTSGSTTIENAGNFEQPEKFNLQSIDIDPNWTEYLDKNNNFSFMYKSDWAISKANKETSSEIRLSKDNHTLIITYEPYTGDNAESGGLFDNTYLQKFESISIDGATLWRTKLDNWDGSEGRFGPYTSNEIVINDEYFDSPTRFGSIGSFSSSMKIGDYVYKMIIDYPEYGTIPPYNTLVLKEIDTTLSTIKWAK